MNVESLMDLGMDKLFLFFTTMLLCFARFIGFMLLGPLWGSAHIRPPIKVGFSALLVIIIWPFIPIPSELPGGPIMLILLVAIQIFVGFVISYVSHILLAISQFGGQVIDIQTGLSSAVAQDPIAKDRVNLIHRVKLYLTLMVFLSLNGHLNMIKAIVRSFEVVPLTGARLSGAFIHQLITMTSEIFLIGIQIAMPVMGALFIVQIALGIMARVAPQMNVFMLSFPLNILVGLSLLIAAMPVFVRRLEPIISDNLHYVMRAIEYMIPK